MNTDNSKKPMTKDRFDMPTWKRMGIAVLEALVIDAIFMVALLIPIVGFVLAFMLGPYTAAMVAGKWLKRNKRGEWLWSTFWVTLIWPSIITVMVVAIIKSLGVFQFVLDDLGEALTATIYIIIMIFSMVGFYYGSEVVKDKEEPKKPPASKKPVPKTKEEPKLETPIEVEKYPGEGGIDE